MRAITFLFFFLLNQIVFSQHFTASVSGKLDYHGSLIFVRAGGYFYSMDVDWNMQMAYTAKLYKARHSIKLSKYDKDMKLVREKKFADGKKEFGPLYPELKEFNGKLYLFYYQLGDEKDNLKIFQSEIDPNTLDMLDPKGILEVEQKNFGFFKAMFGSFNQNLFIHYSPDKTKVVVFWSSDQVNKVFFSVLDSKMNILRKVSDDITGVEKLETDNVCVDNSGNVFVSYNKSNLYANKFNGEDKKFVIKAGGSGVYRFYTSPSTNAEIVYITGIYSEIDDKVKGIFSQTLNTSTMVLSAPQKTLIPQEIKNKLSDQLYFYYDKPKKFYTDPLEFESVIGEDGQIDLFGKSLKTNIYTFTSGNMRTEKVWGSYLYIQVKQDKVVFTRIPKVSAQFGSCMAFKFNNKAYVFYKDDEKNKNADIIDNTDKTKLKIVQMGALIDENGNLNRELVNVSIDGTMAWEQAIKESPSSFLIPGGSTIMYEPVSGKVELHKKSDFFWVTLKAQ